MIIGSGQLAQAFTNKDPDNTVIFASGVSNSNCLDDAQFERERKLLLTTLQEIDCQKFIYFSSCALSASEYPKNAYYKHKMNMEALIKSLSTNYYIFRLPQLFGSLKHHNTLINFLYESIKNEESYSVYSQAYRYVIEINDVTDIVVAYLQHHDHCITVDIANPYRYKVTQIVKIFEDLIGKKSHYTLINREDGYTLDLSDVLFFTNRHVMGLDFGEEYLSKKLKLYLPSAP